MNRRPRFEIVRVFITGLDSLTRSSLKAAMSGFDDLEVVGMASLDDELSNSMDAFQPDVVLAQIDEDAGLPGQLEALLEVDLPIVILSDQRQDLGSLAHGWLSVGSSPDQIRAALLAVIQGLMVYDKDQPSAMISPQHSPDDMPVDPMTARELEVLELVAEGLTNRAIAFELGISEFTVKFHINAIMTKLDAQSRTEASIKAARLGLILL